MNPPIAMAGKLVPAPIVSGAFVRGYVVTMRPYLLFISGITGILGLALAPSIPAGTGLILAAVFFLSYGFGQALTDCYQTDTDALSAPYRPLVRGAIRRRDVMAVSIVGLAACGLALALAHPVNFLLATLAVAGLVTYTPFKRRWWAGPFYNAWIVTILAITAHLSALGTARAPLRLTAELAGGLITVFFGYANFVLAGYFKDMSADRATGYRTLPVAFGFGRAAIVSDFLAFLAVAGCARAVRAQITGAGVTRAHAAGFALLTAGATVMLLGQIRLHRVRHESEAHYAIAPVVHAYVLLLAGLAALAKPSWAPGVTAFYGAFAYVLRGRPDRRQI